MSILRYPECKYILVIILKSGRFKYYKHDKRVSDTLVIWLFSGLYTSEPNITVSERTDSNPTQKLKTLIL